MSLVAAGNGITIPRHCCSRSPPGGGKIRAGRRTRVCQGVFRHRRVGEHPSGRTPSTRWRARAQRRRHLDGGPGGCVGGPLKAKISPSRAAPFGQTSFPDLTRPFDPFHLARRPRHPSYSDGFHDPWVDNISPTRDSRSEYTPDRKPIHIDWLGSDAARAQDCNRATRQGRSRGQARTDQLDYVSVSRSWARRWRCSRRATSLERSFATS